MNRVPSQAWRHCLATGLIACLGAFGLVVAPPTQAAAAPEPVPLTALLQRLPVLPTTAAEAAQWFDGQGQLMHPGMLALRADIRLHQRALEPLGAALGEQGRAQGLRTAANLSQGMASAGIDMERLQRDPAYAREVQARLQQMSPQQMLALSAAMSRPGNADPGQRNAAADSQADPPAVRAAAQAGQAYLQATAARSQTHAELLRERDREVATLMQRPLKVPTARPATVWDDPACEPGCRAQWQRRAQQLQPLMQARAAEVLRVHQATLDRQRALLAAEVQVADAHLRAAGYGAASHSGVNQQAISAYDGAVIGELLRLWDETRIAASEAATVQRCGVQAVLVAGACH